MESRNDYRRLPADEVRCVVAGVLEACEVPAEDAAVVAEVLVCADLRGIESHGVSRLIPYYVDGIRAGHLNPRARPSVQRSVGGLFAMDGDNGLGHVVGKATMNRAIEGAWEHGIGMGAVGNSNHFGIAGYYSAMALEHGMIGFCLSNSRPLVMPTGSRKAVLGTNPLSIAIPAGRHAPLLLDMATSGVPIGKVEVKRRRGEKVPRGWGADSSGRPTEDPAEIIGGGALFPLGGPRETAGYKGYGLGAVVDILSGVLSGSSFLTSVLAGADPGASGVGHFMGAMRVDPFCEPGEFAERMDRFIDELRGAPLAVGEEEILIAGDPERRLEEENHRLGISLHRDVWNAIAELASELGVEGVQ